MPKIPFVNIPQLVRANPVTAAATLFAPLFIKNEDRGYFRSATITTPLVIAGSRFLPPMFTAARDMSIETARALSEGRKIFTEPAVARSARDKAISEALVMSRKGRNIGKEIEEIDKYFSGVVANAGTSAAGKTRLITNAMTSARRSSMTPEEWNESRAWVGKGIPETPKNLPAWMQEEYTAMMSATRPEAARLNYIQTLKQRLREVDDLRYSGTIPSATLDFNDAATGMFPLAFGKDEASAALMAQAPDTYKQLKAAVEGGYIRSDIQLNMELAQGVTSGQTGRVLNIKVTRTGNFKGESLVIPVMDRKTGQIRYSGNAIGVGNYVIDPRNASEYTVDEWISKNLAENPAFDTKLFNEEIAAHAYWMAGDPLDEHRVAELSSMGEQGRAFFNEPQIQLRSHAAGVSRLPFYDGKNITELDEIQQTGALNKILNSGKYVPMGSEAGIREFRFVRRKATLLNLAGAPSASKQDPIWRSITKEISLNAPANRGVGITNPAWEGLFGASSLPAVGANIASLSPADRAIFGELPQTLDELLAQREAIVAKLEARGLVGPDAANMFGTLEDIYRANKQSAFKHMTMGETTFSMTEDFAKDLSVGMTAKYNVDELGVKAGQQLTEQDVLGFRNAERVTPKFAGEVIDVAFGEPGSKSQFVVNVRHQLPIGGSKLDVMGVKGMTTPNVMSSEEAGTIRDVMNQMYGMTGSGDFIPEGVNMFTPEEYFANKVEPSMFYLMQGKDLSGRMEAAGLSEATSGYKAAMSEIGFNINAGQMVIDASKWSTADEAASQRLIALTNITEDFFVKAGDAIKKAGGYQDPVLNAFVHHGKDLGQFLQKNQMASMVFAWDHSKANVPDFMRVSADFFTYMAAQGQNAGLTTVRSRIKSVSGGDPYQALQFAEHIMGTKQYEGVTVPIADAFSGAGALTKADVRAGTIFDPYNKKFDVTQNFFVDIGGEKIPVPGTNAYGAEANLYGPGEYATKEWQNILRDMSMTTDAKEMSSLRERLNQSYMSEFAYGKGSAVNPYMFDPMSTQGWLAAAPDLGDPFLARLSPEMVEGLRGDVKQTLKKGGMALGVLNRQPTNALPYMKFVMDKDLRGSQSIAVSERMSRALAGDIDKDLSNAILFDANVRMRDGKMIVEDAANVFERKAAQEAISSIEGGKSLKYLKIWEMIKGTSEVATMSGRQFEGTPMRSRAMKFANAVAGRTDVAIARSAGGSIGEFSNVLTGMMEQVARSPEIMADEDLALRLTAGLYDIRQAPIRAQKTPSMNLIEAKKYAAALRRGMAEKNPETAAERLHGTLSQMMGTLYGTEGPEFKYWAGQGKEDLQKFAAGRTAEAAAMAELNTLRPKSHNLQSRLKRIFGMGIESVLGPIHGGRAAEETASRAGVLAQSLIERGRSASESVTGKMGKIFSKHAGTLALGLGVMAAVGIALTPARAPVASFGRATGNKYRPEERMGVSDAIPGEPVPGQMAPSNPPRRIEAVAPGVRKAVVAPMMHTSDLSVRMRATDQDRAADTVRQLAMIPGSGETNVTVNYRDRTRLRSLRTREKIRELR